MSGSAGALSHGQKVIDPAPASAVGSGGGSPTVSSRGVSAYPTTKTFAPLRLPQRGFSFSGMVNIAQPRGNAGGYSVAVQGRLCDNRHQMEWPALFWAER